MCPKGRLEDNLYEKECQNFKNIPYAARCEVGPTILETL